MVVEIYVNDKEMILSCVCGRNMGGVLCKYLEISMLVIKCNLSPAIISFCDIF